MIGTHHTVKHMNENDKIVLEETAREEDDLKCNWSTLFVANTAPPLRFADPDREAFANCIPKLKDSVPFLTYGYHKSTFTPEQMIANETVNSEICRRHWHPFLLVEASSIDLPFQQGMAQALRAAAATINLKRKLIEESRSTVNADISTTQQHSADSSASTLEHNGINYHMHALQSYYFGEGGDHWVATHHDLDNVLDWGVAVLVDRQI